MTCRWQTTLQGLVWACTTWCGGAPLWVCTSVCSSWHPLVRSPAALFALLTWVNRDCSAPLHYHAGQLQTGVEDLVLAPYHGPLAVKLVAQHSSTVLAVEGLQLQYAAQVWEACTGARFYPEGQAIPGNVTAAAEVVPVPSVQSTPWWIQAAQGGQGEEAVPDQAPVVLNT